jgi:hypothetical protein
MFRHKYAKVSPNLLIWIIGGLLQNTFDFADARIL